MNVQDAKELTITEGQVRTIHDANGVQLWGRLAYNTTYNGDTTQQTYSGKNLTNFTTISFSGANSGSATRDGGTLTVTCSDSSANSGVQFSQASLMLEPDTTYTFSAKITSTTSTIGSAVYVSNAVIGESSGIFGNQANAGGISSVTFTTASSIPSNASIRLYGREAGATAVFTDLQVEKGSTATTYEPYVGGVASPNPSYPQTVNVVTGTQTITLSDGVISDDYTVGLGTIELCKIGTYQDYIYKSSEDWYVHKETNNVTLDGSETWGYTSGSSFPFRIKINDAAQLTTSSDVAPSALSDNYMSWAWNASTNRLNYCMAAAGDASSYSIAFRNTGITSKADWLTWLSTHNTLFYYPLATPTDTKITDATLIGQLNAIHEWLTRYGYQSSVNGSLPIVITQTTITE